MADRESTGSGMAGPAKILGEWYRVNLKNCVDEPLHLCGSVQGFSVLVGIDPDSGHIFCESPNVGGFFNGCASVLGQIFFERLDPSGTSASELKNAAALCSRLAVRRSVRLTFKEGSVTAGLMGPDGLDCLVYFSSGLLLIEWDRADHPALALSGASSEIHSQMASSKPLPLTDGASVEECAQSIAEWVRAQTGYSRVFVYQFDESFNGRIIAESREEDLESFLWLNYPAADIPPQARELYLRNRTRVIGDSREAGVPLRFLGAARGVASAGDERLGSGLRATSASVAAAESGRSHLEGFWVRCVDVDLSLSGARSPSPIHLRYLQNMGVRSAFSLSIVVNQRLWGLVAAHKSERPFVPPFRQRLLLDQMVPLISAQFAQAAEREHSERVSEKTAGLKNIRRSLASGLELEDVLSQEASPLLKILDACGFVLNVRGHLVRIGRCPDDASVKKICASANGRVLKVQSIAEWEGTPLSEARARAGSAPDRYPLCGFMVFPLIEDSSDIVSVWFREEIHYQKVWAGRPGAGDGPAERLTPRGSFALWTETVKGNCKPWTSVDEGVAAELNASLIPLLHKMILESEAKVALLQQAETLKDKFVANVSHELRTPLNAILGWSQLALEQLSEESLRVGATADANGLHEEISDALKVIVDSAQLQNNLISDLLDFSRFSKGNVSLARTEFDLVDLSLRTVRALDTFAKSAQVDVHVVIKTPLRLSVYLDQDRVRQILMNLLSNALKFTPAKGSVDLELGIRDSELVITVRDTGLGMSPDVLESVFSVFARSRKSVHGGIMGSGLGLSIARELAALHGGELRAFSAGEGRGSTFECRIPDWQRDKWIGPQEGGELRHMGRTQTGDVPADVASKSGSADTGVWRLRRESEGASGAATVAPQPGCGSLAGKRVLIAEDDMPSQRFLKVLLTRAGAEVVVSSDGVEALSRTAEGSFDLLCFDLGMPRMDGFALMRAVREQAGGANQSTPAIAVSAYTFARDRAAALAAGFNAHIAKPYQGEDLIALVRNVLAGDATGHPVSP